MQCRRTQPQRPDVAVIGGGVIGLAVAWRAAQRGHRVCVLERGELGGGASHVAAGMLAPVTEADAGELALLELGLRSARAVAARSPPSSQQAARRRSRACAAAARSSSRATATRREALERELALRLELGLDVRAPAAERGAQAASRRSRRRSGSRSTCRATTRPTRARWCSPSLRPRRRAGVTLRTGARRRADRVASGAKITGVELAGGEVVARRARSSSRRARGAARSAACRARIPLRPVKGQILRLRDPPGRACCERIVRFEGGYLVPRGDGRYVLGATMEERGFDTTVTAGGLYELLRDAGELVPGIHELVVEEIVGGPAPGDARQRAGARPRRRARGPRLGDRPSPQRDPARAGDAPSIVVDGARRRGRRRVGRAFAARALRAGGGVIYVNGEPVDSRRAPDDPRRPARAPTSIPTRAGIAVAVDAEVARRGVWPTRTLADGARVEIVTATQGG